MLVEVRADHAKATDHVSTTHTDVCLLGNVVKVKPLAVLAAKNSLGAKHLARLAAVKRRENVTKLAFGIRPCGLLADTGKDLVGVVMVVVMMVMSATAFMIVIMMVMLMSMMVSALAFVVVVVIVMMLTTTFMVVVVIVMMLTTTFVVVVVIAVMFATTFMVVVVIVMMLATTFMVVVVIVMMSALAFVLVMMVMLVFFEQLGKLGFHRALTLHRRQHILSVKLIPRRGDDDRIGILLAKERYRRRQLFLVHSTRAAEYDGVGILDLIVIKFAKIFHIHAAFAGVGNRNGATQRHRLAKNASHRAHNVRKLADTRRLDQNAVRRKAIKDLGKRFAEITHERAADTTAVHFGDLDARLAQKAAVNADLAKLVLNENYLFARIGFLQQLFDQRGLARPQKARKYINSGHISFLSAPERKTFYLILYCSTIFRFFQSHLQILCRWDGILLPPSKNHATHRAA